MFRLQPLDLGIGGGDRIDLARQQAIDPAQHCVLFVDHAGNTHRGRRPQGREGGIAAEAHHRARLEAFKQADRHVPPFPDRLRARDPFQRVLAEAPCGQDVHGQEIRATGNLRAALIGNQRDVMAAPFQLGRQREGGQHMPPRAPGGEDEMARGMGVVRLAHG